MIPDECIKFANMEEYEDWYQNHGKYHDYSFEPVCNRQALFDRFVLMYRSNRCATHMSIKKYK